MRPAFTSSIKRRGATALAPTLRLFFLTASDMWHLYCGLARTRSALARDRAANTCHDIEWDDRRWNGCASSSYGARLGPCRALTHFALERYFLPVHDRFAEGFCDCGHADRANPAGLAPAASCVALICWRRPCARASPWALPSGSKPAAASSELAMLSPLLGSAAHESVN